MEKPGLKIDQRYEIVKNLGTGLSGEVMLVQNEDGEQTALKFLKRIQLNISKEEALKNFKNEFEILKQLNHPNISRILDFGYESRMRKYYFTCEFIPGAELHDACEGQSIEVKEKMIVQILRALNYLHSRGIYHFDVKPQNVLVAVEDGLPITAKIIDFGLSGFSSPRKKVGTPSYMAPEVIKGGLLDGRTDLYSMGVLIYKVLTGTNPFACKNLKETLQKQIELVPEPLSSVNPEVPEYWDHIVSRMLEKDPAKRYSQASLIIRDLNFLSSKKFDIETKDTKLSYLPEKGTLIGREQEWKVFTDLFGQIFHGDDIPDEKILIVEGPKGSGKTRILNEAKYYAQLRSVSAKTLAQFETEEEDTDFLLLIDAPNVDADKVNALLQEIKHDRFLILWTTEDAPKNWKNTKTVHLENYNTNQLKQYLESVTGLTSAPEKLIEEVYQRTLGNPLFVTEFIKSLLEQGLLFDSSGKWDATTFKDIDIDFDKIHIPNTVEEQLKFKFESLDLEKQNLLKWLAVNNTSLTIDQLTELTGSPNTAAIILDLINDDMIEKTSREHTYYFKNILLANVIYTIIGTSNVASYHSKLAQIYKDHLDGSKEEERYLFHLGRGSNDSTSKEALFDLGKILMTKAEEEQASIQFNLLLSVSQTPFGELETNARFKLGRAYLNTRQFDKAIELYNEMRDHFLENTDQNLDLLIETYIKIINTRVKQHQYNDADQVCDEAKRWIDKSENRKSYDLVIQNYKADILLKSGKMDEAEQIYLKTRKIWAEELDDQQKQKVDNNRLIEIYILKQDLENGLKTGLENVEVLKRHNNKYQLSLNYYALGDIYHRLGLIAKDQNEKDQFIEKSIHNFETCENLAREVHSYELMFRAFNGLGNLHTIEQQEEKALVYYKRALAVARKQEEYFMAAVISYNMSGIYLRLEQYRDAYTYLVYTINTLENIKEEFSPHREINLTLTYIQIAEVYTQNQQYDKAYDAIDKAEHLMKEHDFLSMYNFWKEVTRAKIFFAEGNSEDGYNHFLSAKALAKSQEETDELERTNKKYVKGKIDIAEHKESKTKGVKVMAAENGNKTTSAEDLQKIIEINKFINSEYDPKQLFKIVLNYALQLTNAEAGFVLLLDEDGNFEIKASLNANASDEEKISMSVARMAIEEGEIITSSDALSDDRFDHSESIVLNELKSVLCLPIRSKNKAIGVFYLDNRYKVSAFESCNTLLLNAFCDQVGIALENSKLITHLMASKDQLSHKLHEATEELEHVKDILKAESESYKTKYAYNSIISRSQPMQEIFKMLDKVTETNLAIFIHGESGTGKELVAKALHYNNPTRSEHRFIAINCGAIPTNLMESELFGHKAGSFTGADKDKKGLFEEANGGTLFLDEIGELEGPLQVKLLRVLQEGEVQRIGESQPIKIDVRIVCASHKDLEDLIKIGAFREDLFYRLCQMKIDLPPLRDRTEDIPLLAKHFIDKFCEQNNLKEAITIPPEFMKVLIEYDWSGNVRELENLISVACALREGDHLSLDNIPPNYGIKKLAEQEMSQPIHANLAHMSSSTNQVKVDEQNTYDPGKTWQKYESVILAKAYLTNKKKKMPTAKALGLSHSTVYKKIADLELDDDSNALFADSFVYSANTPMKDYILKIFEAALNYHDQHPYAAIKQLNVSQGYFYKIMKQFKANEKDSENEADVAEATV